MRMRRFFPLLLIALLLLTGCTGKTKQLPEGMEAATVIAAAIEVAEELGTGEYQAVYDRLRADIAEGLTVEDVAALNPGLGDWVGVNSSTVSGQKDKASGEYYAMATLGCQFDEGKRTINVGFDSQGVLIGLRVSE